MLVDAKEVMTLAVEPIEANRIIAISKPTKPTGKYLVTKLKNT